MNIPSVSLTLTRQYVTELVRSPRATAALGPIQTRAPRPVAPDLPEVGVPSVPAPAVLLAATPVLALQPDQNA